MNIQQPSRATFYTPDGTAWRIERITDRWSLSRYSPASEQWDRIGSYPSRQAAVEVAYRQGDN